MPIERGLGKLLDDGEFFARVSGQRNLLAFRK
jgi:hypothetical protein